MVDVVNGGYGVVGVKSSTSNVGIVDRGRIMY